MARPKGKAIERRRAEQAQERAVQRRAVARRRGLLWGVVALAGVVGVAGWVLTRPLPPGAENIETFPDQGRAHVTDADFQFAYNSDPPTSGPHAPSAAACGIYTEPVPDLPQIHTLEHGAVIVQYDPERLSDDQVERLQRIGRSLGDWTLVAPRSDIPAPVALTAWTKRLLLDEVHESTIRYFHAQFAGQGPERAGCPFQVNQAAES